MSANMFAYCENNAVNRSDPTGHDPVPAWATRICNGTATEDDYIMALSINPQNWGGSAKYKVKKAVRLAREHFEQTGQTGVEVKQISSVFGLAIAANASVGYAVDKSGHKALLITLGGGGGTGVSIFGLNTAGLGIGKSEYDDAIMVWDLAGEGMNVGVTAVALSYCYAENYDTNVSTQGISYSLGVELHAIYNYTWVVPLNY